MVFFIISLVAGFLTILTPCVLPILPIILGGQAVGLDNKKRSYVIIASLSASVFIFTFILRVSTIFININPDFWNYFSAFIIFIFGLSILLPNIWSSLTNSLFRKSNTLLNESYKMRERWWGSIALGASLGPIFTTCSPTFFVILATVLPSSLPLGVLYIAAFVIGLSLSMLLVAFLGQKFLLKVSDLADPNSKFKKFLGVMFIILALLIGFGIIKKIESNILDAGFFDFTKIEKSITNFLVGEERIEDDSVSQTEDETSTTTDKEATNNLISPEKKQTTTTPKSDYKAFRYKEIVAPSGFVNTEPLELKDLVGKKVILLDFMTYSCINCQRTFPYLNAWYDRYKDQGLEIVAIHTPEFAFEQNIENVKKAASDFGLKFPIVLDNEYRTWAAYGNQYWPRKYLIDINGNVVYDHIGEGSYDKTEDKIVELLKERAQLLGTSVSSDKTNVTPYFIYSKSPETYFGAWRNTNFGNGISGFETVQEFTLPTTIKRDVFYLDGKWGIRREYAENIESGGELVFKFDAKEVYIVAEASSEKEIEVYIDGVIATNVSGEDADKGVVKIKDSKLYHLVSLPISGEHTLKVFFKDSNIKIYTFTFG